MTAGFLLAILTLAVVLIITLSLTMYLFSITIKLRKANRLGQLVDALTRIERQTEMLSNNLSILQGAHRQLLSTLQASDEHLIQTAVSFAGEQKSVREFESSRGRQGS